MLGCLASCCCCSALSGLYSFAAAIDDGEAHARDPVCAAVNIAILVLFLLLHAVSLLLPLPVMSTLLLLLLPLMTMLLLLLPCCTLK